MDGAGTGIGTAVDGIAKRGVRGICVGGDGDALDAVVAADRARSEAGGADDALADGDGAEGADENLPGIIARATGERAADRDGIDGGAADLSGLIGDAADLAGVSASTAGDRTGDL